MLNTLRKYGVVKAHLFGSAARGELTPASDLDFLIEMKDSPDYGVLLRLSEELEKSTGYPVDVMTSINPVFSPYIEPDLTELPL